MLENNQMHSATKTMQEIYAVIDFMLVEITELRK